MGATAFVGASHGRLTEDWIFASIQSADAEIRGDLKALRKRSREGARNNPFYIRFLTDLADNVIGAHGIKLRSLVLDDSGEQDSATRKIIETGWRQWGESDTCTADGRLSWLGVTDLLIQVEAQDGDAILRLLPGFKNRFGFAVQVLDADQLDEDFNRPAGRGTNEIRMGVEVNKWGRPVAYHLWADHPTDFQAGQRKKRQRIPADQIVHDYQLRRPGQTRGYPWFAPVLMPGRMLDSLQEAELVASRIAAAKGGVFEQDPETMPDPSASNASNVGFEMEVEPGVYPVLPPGLKLTNIDPQHPNSAFEAFNRIILRSIAAGLGISYSSLTGDLSQVSFSSIRQGTLKERDIYRRLQTRFSERVHGPVFKAWLKWALITGALELPVRNHARFEAHQWTPRGWPWVDPLKDIKAASAAYDLDLISKTTLAAEQGRDLEDIIEEKKRENEMLAKAGLLEPSSTASANASAPPSRIAEHVNGNGRQHAHS